MDGYAYLALLRLLRQKLGPGKTISIAALGKFPFSPA